MLTSEFLKIFGS